MGFDKSVVYNYAPVGQGHLRRPRRTSTVDGKLYDCPAPCLGISITTSNPVWTDLKQKYPATLSLAVGGATIYLTLGVFLGALAARWRGTSADRLLVGGTLVVSSIPFYVVALLAWIYLSLQLQIFPNTGYYPITENPAKTVVLHDAALAGARPDQLHAVRPVHPRPDGGDPQRGLHPHRAGQGRAARNGCCSSTPCAPRSCP